MIKLLQDRIQKRMDTTLLKINKKIELNESCHFVFCCSDLVDEKIKQTKKFEDFIKSIDNASPTIYWFEITSEKNSNLIEAIDICRQTGDFKVPPTNKDVSGKILYVGKVRKKFKDRIYQHLGYGNSKTWSLQLNHWTSKLNLELKLNYMQLSKETNNTALAILEQCTAEELEPILGKHSL